MNRRALFKVSVTTTAQAEDAVADLLSSVLGDPATSYTDAETRTATVAVFCERRPPELEAKTLALRAGLQRITACGLHLGSGRISIRRIKPETWAHSWKRHFKPLEFGRVLLIKPSWSHRRPHRKQAVVVLDPGLSFGTGQHPTTAFCLQQLVACHDLTRTRSFLDIGTGSGILAIAAAKLGYAPVHGYDLDPEAVRIARANACRNNVQHELRISRRDLTKLPQQSRSRYDIICANLTANLLLAQHTRILSRLQRGGTLVLAGILRTEFADVHQVYSRSGLKLVASRAHKEWRAGAFRFAQ